MEESTKPTSPEAYLSLINALIDRIRDGELVQNSQVGGYPTYLFNESRSRMIAAIIDFPLHRDLMAENAALRAKLEEIQGLRKAASELLGALIDATDRPITFVTGKGNPKANVDPTFHGSLL